jgi:hypothetical protein
MPSLYFRNLLKVILEGAKLKEAQPLCDAVFFIFGSAASRLRF